jgi:hypothetical protein
MIELGMRAILGLSVAVVALTLPAVSGSTVVPVPPCPPAQGWISAGTFGPIDNGNGIEFQCLYSLPGQPNQLTLDLHWNKPTARDVDLDYSQCGRATSGGSYYTEIWSKTHFVSEQYTVSAGYNDADVFKADQQVIQQAALTLLAATEKLAKPCTKTPTPVRDTSRPTVALRPAKGRAGTNIAFRFTVRDDSGHANILLTIYKAANNRTVLMRKNYGTAVAARSGSAYTAKIHARNRGTNVWCITATDAAGNKTTACATLVIS